MSLGIFLLVLGAALFHAIWNGLVKGADDKWLNMTAVVVGMGGFGGLSLLFVPFPAPESWLAIAVSVVLHLGYQQFLLASYRMGDLTQVYPIARGTAPLLVASTSVVFLGVGLSRFEMLAVAFIGLGIVSLSLVRRENGLRNPAAAASAVVTGVFIAAYSLVDGAGARVSGSAVGFFGAIAFFNALALAAIFAVWRPRLITSLPSVVRVGVLGGGASFAAYTMVVYAFTQAPIALVTALREVSIVFALLIGVFALKERLNLAKLVSVIVTLSGAVLLRLGRG